VASDSRFEDGGLRDAVTITKPHEPVIYEAGSISAILHFSTLLGGYQGQKCKIAGKVGVI
jgi:hypothetical protein